MTEVNRSDLQISLTSHKRVGEFIDCLSPTDSSLSNKYSLILLITEFTLWENFLNDTIDEPESQSIFMRVFQKQ
jgi:hypothetical protein